MAKYFLHFQLTFFLGFAPILGQSQPLNPYFKAISQLQNDIEVHHPLAEVFCKKRPKLDCVDFTVNPKTELLPIHHFTHTDSLGIKLGKDVVTSPNRYSQLFANIERISLFEEVENSRQAALRLTFSPILENFLIAEFLIAEYNISQVKMGPVLLVLFTFNDAFEITNVSYAHTLYN